jgi:hypothetical protein
MATVNTRRVALGALAGGLVWSIWSTFVNLVILEPRYALEQSAGTMLKQPRYPLFLVYWFVTWAPVSRHLPLWWMLDLWLGAIFASLVAGWIYKD